MILKKTMLPSRKKDERINLPQNPRKIRIGEVLAYKGFAEEIKNIKKTDNDDLKQT